MYKDYEDDSLDLTGFKVITGKGNTSLKEEDFIINNEEDIGYENEIGFERRVSSRKTPTGIKLVTVVFLAVVLFWVFLLIRSYADEKESIENSKAKKFRESSLFKDR